MEAVSPVRPNHANGTGRSFIAPTKVRFSSGAEPPLRNRVSLTPRSAPRTRTRRFCRCIGAIRACSMVSQPSVESTSTPVAPSGGGPGMETSMKSPALVSTYALGAGAVKRAERIGFGPTIHLYERARCPAASPSLPRETTSTSGISAFGSALLPVTSFGSRPSTSGPTCRTESSSSGMRVSFWRVGRVSSRTDSYVPFSFFRWYSLPSHPHPAICGGAPRATFSGWRTSSESSFEVASRSRKSGFERRFRLASSIWLSERTRVFSCSPDAKSDAVLAALIGDISRHPLLLVPYPRQRRLRKGRRGCPGSPPISARRRPRRRRLAQGLAVGAA